MWVPKTLFQKKLSVSNNFPHTITNESNKPVSTLNSWNKDQICINTTKSNKAKTSNTVSPRSSFFQWLSLKQELCSALNPNFTQCFSNLFLTHPILRTILHCNKIPIFLHTYVCTVCIYVTKQKSQKIILFLISYNFIFFP